MQVKVFCAHDEMVPLSKIKPNPRNPNQHPQRQIELLARIITEQGWRAPITVSTRSGLVVRGHGRLMAAQHAKLKQAPVDYQDYDSDASELADLIADNQIAELSEIDDALLREMISDIEGAEFDVSLTGFDEAVEEMEAGDGDEEAAHAEPLRQRTFGMVWALIGIPVDEWANVAEDVQRLGNVQGAFCETVVKDE